MKNPSPDDLANTWKTLAGDAIDPDALDSMVDAIRCWSTGRLATGSERQGTPIIISWQWIQDSVFVTMR